MKCGGGYEASRIPESGNGLLDRTSGGGAVPSGRVRENSYLPPCGVRVDVWQCNHKYARGKKGAKCPGPIVKEQRVHAAFLAAFNQRITDRAAIFAAYDEVIAALTDTTALETEAAALTGECEIVTELLRKAVEENARAPLDQDDYEARRAALLARYEAAEARLGEIEAARAERRAKRVNIDRFLEILKKQDDLVTEFDEELWYITVDRVEVHADGRLSIVFRDYVAVDVAPEK